jgi:hypothetical protein
LVADVQWALEVLEEDFQELMDPPPHEEVAR